MGIPPHNGRGRSSNFTFLQYIHSTWTHHHCYATWCFLHWNTSLLLRDMMFLTLEDIFTATQHDVSCTGTHVGATQHDVWGWGVCFWVGWGVGWGGMFPFVALARILMLRNMLSLALEHIFTATQHDVSYTRRHLYCYATWCFLHWKHIFTATQHDVWGWVVCFWVGRGGCFRSLHLHASWCYATWCFFHWTTSLLLRNMMFLTLEDIFTATQHDVSCTISASRMKTRTWVCWQNFQRYSTLELLESICTSMEHWREKPCDEDDFLQTHNFFNL